jgi:chaperone required for assembly of F1-ATPase
VLAWAAEVLQAPLVTTRGVMHVAQPQASLAAIRRAMSDFGPYELVGVHDLVAISGSAVLALAVTHGHLSADAAWQASRIDETWQAELWGQDDEAAAAEAQRRADFFAAERFLRLCR